MLCSACGRQVDDRSPFCSSCGVPAARGARRSVAKTVVTASGLVAVGILCLGAIALAQTPKLEVSRMIAQETAAILNIRTIHTAQVQYFTQFDRYARSLSELGPPSKGSAGPSSADLIPADLAAGTKSGYTFTLHGGPKGYTLNANPVKYGSTGRRTFFSDDSLVIRAHFGPEPATAASDEVK
jgi:type IV pilus assembly protein PilA